MTVRGIRRVTKMPKQLRPAEHLFGGPWSTTVRNSRSTRRRSRLDALSTGRGGFVRAPRRQARRFPGAVIAALHLVITDISGTAFPPADPRLRTIKGSCVRGVFPRAA